MVTHAGPESRRGVRWSVWLTVALVLLSVPLVLLGLWLSLALGEPVYNFCLSLKDDAHFSTWHWRIITLCRFVSWAILVLSALQILLGARALWSVVRPRPADQTPWRGWHTIGLGGGMVALLALECFWISQMLPIAALMRAVQQP